jgi:hypothetical protein
MEKAMYIVFLSYNLLSIVSMKDKKSVLIMETRGMSATVSSADLLCKYKVL